MKVNCSWTICKYNSGEFANDLMGHCLKEEITLTDSNQTEEDSLLCEDFEWSNKKFRRVKDAK